MSMRLLVFSDIHGRTDAFSLLKDEFDEADLVVLTGDITHFGKTEQAQAIVSRIRKFHPSIVAVTGNCDYQEAETYFEQEGLSLHLRHTIVGGYDFSGISGSLPCPGTTPQEHTEEEYAGMLEEIGKTNESGMPMVLAIHQPPADTVCDRVKPGLHVGSYSVRQFIDSAQPLICLCGHIHEGIGIDRIAETVLVNPGPFRSGQYARISLEGNEVSAEIRNIHTTRY